jgi:hypothetical protein
MVTRHASDNFGKSDLSKRFLPCVRRLTKGEQHEIDWRIAAVSLCGFVRAVVGFLQGMAFSCHILVACDSHDLAQTQPAVVPVVADQCSRCVAHRSSTLYPEHPDLGVIKHREHPRLPEKLQRCQEWCNNS